MENISRRGFVKSIVKTSLLLTPFRLLAKKEDRLHISLPKKPFEYYILKGEKKGGRVLIIGGIHGNEIGAYKASDILVDLKVKMGELIIIPRSNFTSILANVRGYNGDMNRKFSYVSKKDPDFYYITLLKEAIKSFKPDVVISLHDGYGFNRLNKNHWGQCVVIDENHYKNFNLYSIASFIVNNSNRFLTKKEKISICNTKTFTSNLHKEQRNALTGWCLKNDILAFCIEASKQLPKLEDKIKTHLVMLREFFTLFNIKTEPSLDYVLSHLNEFNYKKESEVVMDINGQYYRFKKSQKIKIKKGADIKIVSINGHRGSYLVPHRVNLNWKSFYFSNPLIFKLKHDYETKFKLKIIPI